MDTKDSKIAEKSSICKTNQIVALVHKWTIKNFGYFYRDEWKIDEIVSDKFYSNEERQFYLCLYPNGNRNKFSSNLSIFLYFYFLPGNVDVNVRCKISIIDENGEKHNTKEYRYTFNEKQYSRGFAKYISVSQLLNHSNGLLSDDTLTLWCEVQVIEDGDGQIEDNTSTIVEVSESHHNAIPRVINSLAHKWTIGNFGNLYRDEWGVDKIDSGKFYSNKERQFYLRLYPNGNRDEFRNNLTIFLYHSSPENVGVNIRYKISIIDEKGEKHNTKALQYMIREKEGNYGFGKYISVSQLLDYPNGLLTDNRLTLLCEMQVIENINLYITEPNAKPISTEYSQSYSNAIHYQKTENKENDKLSSFVEEIEKMKILNKSNNLPECSIKLTEVETIVLKLIENNQLLIEMKSSLNQQAQNYDFTNAKLENVVFTCNSTSETGDININGKTVDMKFIMDNIDQLIKDNFDKAVPLMKDSVELQLPIESIVQNEKTGVLLSLKQNTIENNQSSSSTSENRTSHYIENAMDAMNETIQKLSIHSETRQHTPKTILLTMTLDLLLQAVLSEI